MKKLTTLFLSLVALASVVSCNSDDDDNNGSSTSASIEGKWEIIQEGVTLSTLETIENEGNCGATTVEYIKGGNFVVKGFDYEASICDPFTDGGTWIKSGNTFTEKYSDNDTYVYEIIELTETSLKLKETDEEGTWYSVFKRK